MATPKRQKTTKANSKGEVNLPESSSDAGRADSSRNDDAPEGVARGDASRKSANQEGISQQDIASQNTISQGDSQRGNGGSATRGDVVDGGAVVDGTGQGASMQATMTKSATDRSSSAKPVEPVKSDKTVKSANDNGSVSVDRGMPGSGFSGGGHRVSGVEGQGIIPDNRMPPQALETEMCVLGSMVLDKDCIGEIIPILRRENFYRYDHQLIFDALIKLYEDNKPIDLVLLRDELKNRGQLDEVGGVEYLVKVANSVPSAANGVYYAKIVRDKALLRNLISATAEISNQAYAGRGKAEEILEEAEQRIFEVTEQKITGQAIELKDVLEQVYESLQSRRGQLITGLATGYLELDELTCGLQPGEMIIIAARPSMGKTALGLNIAEYIGADCKTPVAVFSLEMSAQQLTERMLAGRSHIDSQKLRKGMLNDQEYQLLANTAAELAQSPIYVDDSAHLTPLELRAKARRLKVQKDIGLIVIDYLQLMHVNNAESRLQEVGIISRHLKALARELRIPVVVMAQLNRGPEGREGHRPRMSDLRESGNIEQDADVVMLLHREGYYKQGKGQGGMGEDNFDVGHSGGDDDNIAELIIAKQRNGPTDTVKLTWCREWTRFENLAKASEYGF